MVGTSGTSINITNETGQILNALKTKRRLPSLEATIQWLFASLDAEGKKEIALITDFLALPPPFINAEEVVRHFAFTNTDLRNAIDETIQKLLAEKMDGAKVTHEFTKHDIDAVIGDLVKEKKAQGLARYVFELYKKDIVDGVVSKIKQSTNSAIAEMLRESIGEEKR
jgi:hypothetical protein